MFSDRASVSTHLCLQLYRHQGFCNRAFLYGRGLRPSVLPHQVFIATESVCNLLVQCALILFDGKKVMGFFIKDILCDIYLRAYGVY